MVSRVVCNVFSSTWKSPGLDPFSGRASATTRSLGSHSKLMPISMLLLGSSHRSISALLGMNGVSSKYCACLHSRLMVASSSSSRRPRIPDPMPCASSTTTRVSGRSILDFQSPRSTRSSFSGVATRMRNCRSGSLSSSIRASWLSNSNAGLTFSTTIPIGMKSRSSCRANWFTKARVGAK